MHTRIHLLGLGARVEAAGITRPAPMSLMGAAAFSLLRASLTLPARKPNQPGAFGAGADPELRTIMATMARLEMQGPRRGSDLKPAERRQT